MRLTLNKWLVIASASAATLLSAQAQTLVDTWTYAGGGLDPATYGGDFQPSPLLADSGLTDRGTISVTGVTSGGLGSSTTPTGYGGYYTFFSANPSFTAQTSTILDSLDEITFSLVAGGGNPTQIVYDGSSLTLNYNGANPAVASSGFNAVNLGPVPTPIGPLDLTRYTWTWTDLSAMGTTTEFSTAWDTGGTQHVFYQDFSLTQAVPEPSTVCLILLGGALCALRRKRRNSPAH